MDGRLDRAADLRERLNRIYWESPGRGYVDEGPLDCRWAPGATATPGEDGPRPFAHRAGNWLFIKGGMSMLVILGLILSGLGAGVSGCR